MAQSTCVIMMWHSSHIAYWHCAVKLKETFRLQCIMYTASESWHQQTTTSGGNTELLRHRQPKQESHIIIQCERANASLQNRGWIIPLPRLKLNVLIYHIWMIRSAHNYAFRTNHNPHRWNLNGFNPVIEHRWAVTFPVSRFARVSGLRV